MVAGPLWFWTSTFIHAAQYIFIENEDANQSNWRGVAPKSQSLNAIYIGLEYSLPIFPRIFIR